MKLLKRYNLPASLWFASLQEMIDKTKPEVVCAYNSIFEHLKVVETCAPRGIHVMVEKPLAVNLEHAEKMEKLAKTHKIQLLTNYETTWYASHQAAYGMIHGQGDIGQIRKVVIHDGHRGPKEIGCTKEFLDWLTDPVMNGGGAVIDFGCYGANLMTWLQKGERPVSVTAVTQQMKPDVYPNVDDEATIVITYPNAQAIVQASWNWPFDRKDIEIYGQNGYIFADRSLQMRVRKGAREAKEETVAVTPLAAPVNDAFTYLKAAVRGQTDTSSDLSSLKVNRIVVEILDAAVRSAKTGKTVVLK
jgi:predicted dehydrogenase